MGVNLLYGAFFLSSEPEELVESLLDGLSTDRIEIDVIEFSGIEYRYVDPRVMTLKLVQLGLTGAAMFCVSDLSVARDRFVSPGFVNGAWGLPLYFGGQLLLAASVAG